MRWSIVGVATACVIALGALVYGRMASTAAGEKQDWRQRELAFLTSVHHRIETELERQPSGAGSLRSEERAILKSMAELTKPMPVDRIPANVRLLLANFDLTKDDAATSSVAAASPVTSVDRPTVFATLDSSEGPIAQPATDRAGALEGVAASSEKDPTGPPLVDEKPASELARVEPGDLLSLAQLEETLHAEKTARGLRIRLPAEALFGPTSATLDAAADPSLSRVVELITVMGPREVVVVGHTDASSNPDADLALSKKRAQVFARGLKGHGLSDPPHLVTVGYGGTRPVAPNENADGSDNPDGRQQNRRIEILLRRH